MVKITQTKEQQYKISKKQTYTCTHIHKEHIYIHQHANEVNVIMLYHILPTHIKGFNLK